MENSIPRSEHLQKAALKLAGKNKPVFPCKGKEPLTANGFYDATTHPGRISAFWNRHPGAMIGMPTGKRSDVLVLDEDRPGAVGELPHELPETLTIHTPSGGRHYYFKHVEGITNSNRGMPEGIDIRAEGGYVIVPPSSGYSIEHRAPVADAPEWLIEILQKKTPRPGTNSEATAGVKPDITAPIYEGRRNITLTSIAGYLHDGSRDLTQLTSDLLQINTARCTPPLEVEEVEGIARSVYRLEPCQKGSRFDAPTPEVIGLLRDILEDWWREDWRGPGGKSNRDVLLAYIMFAIERGTILPNGGILVDASHHQVAERARKSSSTAYNAHKRLSSKYWCRGGGNGPDRREDQPAGIVLLPRPHKRRKPEHPQPCSSPLDGVFDFASLPTARRGRHSAPGLVRIASAARVAAIDHLEQFGSFTSERTIADAMCIARVYDLRKRYLEPLEAQGVVERIEGRAGRRRVYSWRLTEDWQAALDQVFAEEEDLERELYSGLTSDERQKKRREEARERWRNRDNVCSEPTPSSDELRQRRESYPERRRQGIRDAMTRLFAGRPEYRERRVGQITCALPWHLPKDFPQGPDGAPKDSEIEAILDGVGASLAETGAA